VSLPYLRPKLIPRTIALTLILGALGAVEARAQGVDTTCQFSFTRLDPTTANTLFLDTNAVYWVSGYQAAPGTRIRITGEFPYSRYTSWNVYDSSARPIDALADAKIEPDPGSSNPFLPGADRTKRPRNYTLFLRFEPRPRDPAPNTLYSGVTREGSPNFTGSFWLRMYIPDRGRDAKGGVPLPRITLERDGAAGTPPSVDACLEAQAPYLESINQAIRGSEGTPDFTGESTAYPGRNPPVWRKFVNFSQSFTEVVFNNEAGEELYDEALRFPTNDPRRGAGIFANNDISYVFTGSSRGFGEVLVIRGRAPTFPDTWPPARVMPRGKQLRYFSFCQYEPASQRVIDCVSDHRITVDSKGFYTVVVSTPANRPANARASCGVTWLAWGPAKQGLLIYRHMLAEPSFGQSIEQVANPGLERQTMADYYPDAQYLKGKAAFDARGCAAASGEPGGSDEGAGRDRATERVGAGRRSGGGVSAGTAGRSETGGESGSLPFTGRSLLPFVFGGLLLASCGLLLRRVARRPRRG
jgi:hypothetical protein